MSKDIQKQKLDNIISKLQRDRAAAILRSLGDVGGPSSVRSCKQTSDCKSNEACLDDICIPILACKSNSDCPVQIGLECNPTTSTCARPCKSSHDCKLAGATCDTVSGYCMPTCDSTDDCPDHLVCFDNMCSTRTEKGSQIFLVGIGLIVILLSIGLIAWISNKIF